MPGWTIVNAIPLPGVDVVADISDLRKWEDGVADVVYMSHVLEHLDYMDQLQPTLKEILRVIKPGGMLKCSVPDLAILCQMFVQLASQKDDTSLEGRHCSRLRCGDNTGSWTREDYRHNGMQDPVLPVIRMQVMRMIYGGQMDAFDFHKVGFDFCMLRGFLLAAGFSSVERVEQIDEVSTSVFAHFTGALRAEARGDGGRGVVHGLVAKKES